MPLDTTKTKANYLGDGVYIHLTGEDGTINNGVCLTTGNHDPSYADNIIQLEKSVIDKLLQYFQNPQEY